MNSKDHHITKSEDHPQESPPDVHHNEVSEEPEDSLHKDVVSKVPEASEPNKRNAQSMTQGPSGVPSKTEETAVDESPQEKEPHRRRARRSKRMSRRDAAELRLLGRRALCKNIPDIAANMLKTVKLRIIGCYLKSARGLTDDDLTSRLKEDVGQISDKDRVLRMLNAVDPDVNRRILKWIILIAILLEEETHSLEESRLEDKVLEYEKTIVKLSKNLDFFDPKKHDSIRWHHYDTYRIVLDAAWRSEDDVSQDEANLLAVLREHLNISTEEHWTIGAYLKRFPKRGCGLHTRDEINVARKELHREGLLWSYRDESNRNIDIIPYEIVSVIRGSYAYHELQRTNYRRMLQHDNIKLTDLRSILQSRKMDRYGNKGELIERIINSDIRPSIVLGDLDRTTLVDMCRNVGLKSFGNKPELVLRLIDFYDDLTFEERRTQDEREEWFNNYELLAARAYADLKAKKIIKKDLEIEHQFERATDFLFEVKLNVQIDRRKKGTKADGRIIFGQNQTMLWDCKSVEKSVNLQDHLENQFDHYLRKERERGNQVLVFLVIGPSFTAQSIKIAHQYKARTNWDIALVTAEALKRLADQWSAAESNKPFPIRLLNRTDVIDAERADYLLSLA